MKKLSNARMHSYMHPICTLYAPYMHPIWRTYLARARARARARPALVDVGPPALTHKRELNYFHTRARRQNRVPKSRSLLINPVMKN